MPSFLCLARRRANVEKPAPLVRENINPTTGQELELIRYTKATENVTAAENVGKILFRGRERGEGKDPPSLYVGMHK